MSIFFSRKPYMLVEERFLFENYLSVYKKRFLCFYDFMGTISYLDLKNLCVRNKSDSNVNLGMLLEEHFKNKNNN